MLPPRRVESNEGYFELIEGSSAAPKPVNSITGSNDSSFTQTGTGFGTVGEMGDILMFTTRNSNRPFTGSFQPSTTTSASTIQSETAEVAWFVRGHNLYRRVLLVAPGASLNASASGFYKQNDISVHLQGSNVVPNTLGDLTRRECRFGHDANAWPYKCNWGVAGLPTLRDNTAPGATPTTYATTGGTADYWNESQPFIWLSNANSATGSFGDGTCTRVDDIILTNVIGFDVKVWDPGALAYVDLRDRFEQFAELPRRGHVRHEQHEYQEHSPAPMESCPPVKHHCRITIASRPVMRARPPACPTKFDRGRASTALTSTGRGNCGRTRGRDHRAAVFRSAAGDSGQDSRLRARQPNGPRGDRDRGLLAEVGGGRKGGGRKESASVRPRPLHPLSFLLLPNPQSLIPCRQPALGVQGGHAAAAGGGDGLAIIVVGHVAGGKHALDAGGGPRPAWSSGCISSSVSSSLPFRKAVLGVWPMARKKPVISSVQVGLADGALQADAGHAVLVVAQHFGRRVRFQRISIFGLSMARSAMIFDARSWSRRWTR